MKLLLDEMWPPRAAVQLRNRGHDVAAVAERRDLRGQPDSVVIAVARTEGRVVVTENVADYCTLAAAELHKGHSHPGLVFTIGRLVRALDALLTAEQDLTNVEYWLS